MNKDQSPISKNEFYLVQKNVSDRIRNVEDKDALVHKEITEKLDSILLQTTKHNGRLSKLERLVWSAMGAIVILGWLYTNNFINCMGTKLCSSSQVATVVVK